MLVMASSNWLGWCFGRGPFSGPPLLLLSRYFRVHPATLDECDQLVTARVPCPPSELQGLQVHDVTLSTLPATVGSIRVVRTAKRKGRAWIYGTPKSEASSDR